MCFPRKYIFSRIFLRLLTVCRILFAHVHVYLNQPRFFKGTCFFCLCYFFLHKCTFFQFFSALAHVFLTLLQNAQFLKLCCVFRTSTFFTFFSALVRKSATFFSAYAGKLLSQCCEESHHLHRPSFDVGGSLKAPVRPKLSGYGSGRQPGTGVHFGQISLGPS